MFDKYLICEGTVRNIGPAEAPDGFAFEAKLGYYRGLGLSMVEDLVVSIDGDEIPRQLIRFDEGEGVLTLDQMKHAYDRRWRFGAPAIIAILQPGGFPAGEHKLSLRQKLRISYMPFPSFNNDTKTVSL